MKTSSMQNSAITEYYDKIKSGQIVTSSKVRRVYKKLVDDMNDASSEWEYSQAHADHVIDFIQRYCKHSKGKLGGKPFVLELWQKALLSATFGFIHKIDRTRKYRELILIVGRKNGKSALGSAIGLYMLIADGESGAEIVSAATKKDQAKIIWLEAKRMVNKSPTLRKRIKTLVAEMVSPTNDGSFKPLSSDSNTLDGLNIHCSLIDELHAIKDKNLYDVIVDGMSAREQPLSIITSTAGTIREGIFDIKYQECENIINGYDDVNGYKDERVLPIIYELDKRDEWKNPKSWVKANPGLGTIKSLDQLEQAVMKAKSNSLLVSNLLTKNFNIRETTSQAWLTFEDIKNPQTFDISKLKPKYAIGGVDLSKTTDLTSACIMFKVPNDENIYVEHMYWMPYELIEKRAKEDSVPYDVWYRDGWLRACDGNTINYKDVTAWFIEMQTKYQSYIYKVGYDAWSAKYWVEDMQNFFGNVMVPVIQGKKTLSNPMHNLGADLQAKKIIYNNNPITMWCLTNTSIDIDRNNNIAPIKYNSKRRIDGLAAMLDAYVVFQDNQEDYNNIIY